MKYLLAILLVLNPWTDLDKIARVNKVKKEASKAYLSGDYQTAADRYTFLKDSLGVEDDNLQLNLANAYYHLNDSTKATENYSSLLDSKDMGIRSIANQQLGIMANKYKKHKEALDYFKDALRANPTNEQARYNYELVKKMLKDQENEQQKNQDQQKDQNNQQQDKEQQEDKQNKSDKKDQKDQDNSQQEDQQNEEEQQNKENQQNEKGEDDKEGEKKEQENKEQNGEGQEKEDDKQQQSQGEEDLDKQPEDQQPQPSLSDKLKEMNISEEKAQMILEAMKNNEIQYIQQQKKKAKKRQDPDKPDW